MYFCLINQACKEESNEETVPSSDHPFPLTIIFRVLQRPSFAETFLVLLNLHVALYRHFISTTWPQPQMAYYHTMNTLQISQE